MSRSEATVTLPMSVWGQLASVADHRGVSVSDLLVAAVRTVIDPDFRRSAVLGLARAGLTDREIAESTGETRSYIKDTRLAAGVLANREQKHV